MALGTIEPKIYLNIAFGKLHQKTTADDPQAKNRENKNGKVVYERIHSYVEGLITGLYYRQNQEYGNSWEVSITDGREKYNLSLSEGDKFATDFLRVLPNLDLSKPVRIAPYDFEPDGKRKKGLSIKQGGEKVYSYFHKYEDENLSELHGYPKYEKGMDPEDWKIYNLTVNKFLKKWTHENMIPKFVRNGDDHEDIMDRIEAAEEVLPPIEEEDDLPF